MLIHPERGALSFETPSGRLEVELTRAAQATSQPWYAEAVRRHEESLKQELIGADPLQEPSGEIEVEEHFVEIGGVRIPVSGAPETRRGPQAAPAPPVEAPVAPGKTLEELLEEVDGARADLARVDRLRSGARRGRGVGEAEPGAVDGGPRLGSSQQSRPEGDELIGSAFPPASVDGSRPSRPWGHRVALATSRQRNSRKWATFRETS